MFAYAYAKFCLKKKYAERIRFLNFYLVHEK